MEYLSVLEHLFLGKVHIEDLRYQTKAASKKVPSSLPQTFPLVGHPSGVTGLLVVDTLHDIMSS